MIDTPNIGRIAREARREWELFDLVNDPREMRSIHANLAARATYDSLRSERARLRTVVRDDTGGPLP